MNVLLEQQDLDLESAEMRPMCHESRQPKVDLGQYRCIHEIFEAQVERTPDKVALVSEDQHLTYQNLNRRSNQLAHHLRRLGVGPETPVGICLERSPEIVIGVMGILKAEGAYIPLDPAYPGERISFMLQDSQVPVLLTQHRLLTTLPEQGGEVVLLDAGWDSIAQSSAENLPRTASGQNLAYVIYTSGSTGRPKGVAIEHHSTVAFLDWALDHFGADSFGGILASTSLCFDLSIFELFAPLSCGGTVILIQDTLQLPHSLTASRVTLINTVPSAIAELLRMDGLPPSVHTVNLAGEPLKTPLVQQIYQCKTVRRVFDLYGPSEDTTYSTYALRSAVGPDTIGRPIANTQVYLLNQDLRPVPTGAPGELFLGGAGLARGYLNRPGITAERFIPHPFGDEPDLRLYRTGDLARFLPDGNLEFLGRIDHQVKVRGFRIELGEIETMLAGHPAVREAVVLAWDDERGANGEHPGMEKCLAAYFVPREGQAPRPGELRAYLEERLPVYMVPSAFTLLAAMPLTPNGKIDRRALPSPDWERAEPGACYIPPRTPLEEVLAGIWAEVLRVEQPGMHDNFFDLGGHSLLAARIVVRLCQLFGHEFTVHTLFESPTLAALAAHVEAASGAEPGQELPALEPLAGPGPHPLSFTQQQLWLVDQINPGNRAYNIPSLMRLAGSLDVAVLHRSLSEIVRRHQTLRTTFAPEDGQPVQVITPALALPFTYTDLRHLPEEERETTAQRLAVEAARQPFDLARGPLLQIVLLQLAETEHLLLLTMHHIISDGWSMGVLLAELAALYSAFIQRKPSPLDSLPIQYADLAAWQRAWLRGEVLEHQLAYWQQRLDGAPPLLALPTDRPRPPVQTFHGAHQPVVVPRPLIEGLKSLARQEGATLFMVLLAAFKSLLCHYTGQTDVVVGSPVANRNRVEAEPLIGYFVNAVALRTSLAGNPTFRELLARVRDTALSAYAHQDLPFATLVERLRPERDTGYNPIFQVMLALQTAPMDLPTLPGLDLSLVNIDIGAAPFDLSLEVEENEAGLTGFVEYNTDLFDAVTISRLMEHYQTLLQGIVTDPDQRLADLPYLSDSEQHRLLVEWNETRAAYPQDFCIHELVAAQAVRSPDAVAVTAGDRHLTYAALNRRANRLAHRLRALGIGPEVIVAICVERSVEMVVGLLAILKAGGAYVPLDPAYPRQRLAFMLADSQVPVLLTQEHLLDKLAGHAALAICLGCGWRAFAGESPENPTGGATTDNLAYAIYTSGSTGRPKGVAITHRSLLNLVYWHRRAFSVTAADRATQVAGPAFDASVWEIWPYLSAGASLHIADEETRTLPSRLRDWLAEEQITLSFLPTPLAEAMLALDWPAGLALRCLLTGGDRLHNYPPAGLPFELVNNYGPTEDTVVATSGRVPARDGADAPPPIGRPIANTQAYLLDQDLRPVSDGASGELFVGGIGLARGYLGRPALTAERFIPHPFSREMGARLYRTGDLARYHADGNLEFLGRVDRQVKVRGFRIELDGIETVLASHPAVREAVVLAWDVARGSNGGRPETDKRLAAYLVPYKGIVPQIGELRAYLGERLPAYMVPSTFTLLAAMPLTPNGKIDRRALPPPDWERAEPGTTYVPPRTPLEEMLAEIWAEVLRVERPGVHDNFFDLGGHSLLAAQIVARLRQLFGHDFSVHTLFEAPTLAALAGRVEATSRAEPGQELPPIEPLAGTGPYPLSFTQQQLWLVDQIDPGNLAYNIPFLLRLIGPLDVAVLRRSLSEIVHRHQALRATFATQDDQPVQAIASALGLPFTQADLCHLSEKEREATARRLAVEAARQPFDLAQGPLLRVLLLQLAETEHLLLLTMHHIISDGWSMGVLLAELAALYPAFASGQPSTLASLSIQYADFAAWQRTRLHGETLDARLAYWRQRLDGAPPLLALPTDRPRPPVQTFHGAHQPVALPHPLIAALAALARQEGATLFMALLAAFKALLYHYTDQTDVVVGSPVANRNRVEVEPLIGYFVNIVALRTSLAGNPTFRELLARVRDTALSAYAHQDLPFATLVERLRPERDTGYNPIFQVMLALQTAPMDLPTLPGLDLSLVNIDIGVAQFDLSLEVEESEAGLTGFVEYNTDLFDAVTISRLMEHYQTLLQAIVADPGRTLSALLAPIEVKQRPPVHEARPAVAPVADVKDRIAQREAEFAARLARLPAAEQALLEKRLRGD